MNNIDNEENSNAKLLKNIIIYGFGKSAEQLTRFLLLPLYTRFLSPADYGILALVNLLSSIAGSIFSLGTQSSVFRFYKEGEQNNNSALYYSSIALLSIWITFLLILSFIFKNNLSLILFNDPTYDNHIFIGLLITAFVSFYNIPMFMLRAEKQSKIFVKYNFAKLLINIVSGILFVVILKRSAFGALEATLFSTLFFAIFTNIKRINQYNFCFDINKIKIILHYGSPLVISGIIMVFINSSDRYFLKVSFPLEEIGIYSIGYTIGSSINIFISSFQTAWPQMMFQISDESNSSDKYSTVFTYYVYFIGVIWITLSSFSYEIVYLFTDHKFLKSHNVIPIVALAYAIYGATSITSAGIYIKNKTFNELILMPIVLIICLISNYFLIIEYGSLGAAYATLISFCFMFFLYSLKGSQYLKINYDIIKVFKIIGLFFIFHLCLSFIQMENIWIGIFLKFLVILVMLIITLSLQTFFYKDITSQLLKYFKNK